MFDRTSELSPDDILVHLAVQSQIRHYLSWPGIHVLELLQSPHLIGQQPGLILLQSEVGRLADPRLSADLGNRCPLFALLQDERFVSVRKFARLHAVPLPPQPGKHSGKLKLQTVQFPGIRSLALNMWPSPEGLVKR